jgi:hypothetical protein
MIKHQSESSEIEPPELWLRLGHAKKLARVLRKVAVVQLSQALEAICRSAGYANHNDAFHHPHTICISPEDWRLRLADQLGLDPDDVLSRAEFSLWYSRLFAPRGRLAAEHRLGQEDQGIGEEFAPVVAAESDGIPLNVDHERTIVDSLFERPPRRRRL